MPRPSISSGIYKHFKGGLYEVIGVAERVDSSEVLVIYRPLHGERNLVARPFADFTSTVTRDGRTLLRFAPVELVEASETCENACSHSLPSK